MFERENDPMAYSGGNTSFDKEYRKLIKSQELNRFMGGEGKGLQRIGGDKSVCVTGREGFSYVGDYGLATSWEYGKAEVGRFGIVMVGRSGRFMLGRDETYFCGGGETPFTMLYSPESKTPYWPHSGVVGYDGIEEGVFYKVNTKGKTFKVTKWEMCSRLPVIDGIPQELSDFLLQHCEI
jgi:hypothetical protein